MANEVSYLLDKLAIAAFKVDLDTDRVTVLSNRLRTFENGLNFKWSHYTLICLIGLFADNPTVRRRIRSENLKQMLLSSRLDHRVVTEELVHSSNNQVLILNIVFERSLGHTCAYLTLKEDNNQNLLHSIVNTFVFTNCDYFITVNIKENSYHTIYASEHCTALPPFDGSYSPDMEIYADNFVVPEDRAYVKERMQLARAVKELDENNGFDIYFGVMENGLYRRKKLELRYFDDSKKELLLSRSDVTEAYNQERLRVQRLQEMLKSAYTDALTDLLNRQGLIEELKARVESGRSSCDLALLFIDLDSFKPINDNLGHPIGDVVLKKAGEVLKSALRTSADLASRQGGDEFIVVLDNLNTREDALQAAQSIITGIEEIVPDERSALRISCSIGIAFLSESAGGLNELIALADERVYKAKAQGKGRIADK